MKQKPKEPVKRILNKKPSTGKELDKRIINQMPVKTLNDYKGLDCKIEIHKIIQKEVAGEMWYESHSLEEQMLHLLKNLELKLIDKFNALLTQQRTQLLEEILKQMEFNPETDNFELDVVKAEKLFNLLNKKDETK